MKKLFSKKYSIKYKYIVTILPFLLLSYLLLFAVIASFYLQSVHHSVAQQSDSLLDAVSTSVETSVLLLDQDTDVLLYNISMQDAIYNACQNGDKEKTALLRTLFSSETDSLALFLGNTLRAYFLLPDETVISASSYPSSVAVSKELLCEAAAAATAYHGQLCFYVSKETMLAAKEAYLWTGKTQTTGTIRIGTILLEINLPSLQSELSARNGAFSFALLSDRSGEILLNETTLDQSQLAEFLQTHFADMQTDSDNAQTGSSNLELRSADPHTSSAKIDGTDYLLTTKSLECSGLAIAMLANQSVLYHDISVFLVILAVIVLISVTVIAFAILAISSRISSEFSFFIRKLNDTSTINEHAYVHMDSTEEFVTLAQVYNDMLTRIDTLSEKMHEQQLLTKDAQIKSLQAQINPHFLYNTLNCISGLIDLERKEDGKKAIAALADIERMSIKGAPFLTLQEDLAYIRKYLYIQQLRFENRFLYLIEMPDELTDCAIPKLVIQPLIENAVLHGISATNEKGAIGVFISARDQLLTVTVKDNGPGFSEELIQSFPDGLSGDACYGLRNIDRRLKLYYGSSSGLFLTPPHSGKGACISLRIPCMTLEEHRHRFPELYK